MNRHQEIPDASLSPWPDSEPSPSSLPPLPETAVTAREQPDLIKKTTRMPPGLPDSAKKSSHQTCPPVLDDLNLSSSYPSQASFPNPDPSPPPAEAQSKASSIMACIIGAAAVIFFALAAFLLWRVFLTPGSSMTMRSTRQDYLILYASAVYSSPDTSLDALEAVYPGTLIYLEKTGRDEQGRLWGVNEDGNWILVEDSRYTYLLPVEETSYLTTSAESYYDLLSPVKIYAAPDGISPALDVLDPATMNSVYVFETTTRPSGQTWARIGEHEWICIQDDQGTYLKPAGLSR